MSNFKNDIYELIASDLINDAFYLDGISQRGAISSIRTYTEILVRRILNLPVSRKVTIGDWKIENDLKKISNDNKMLMNAIKKIKKVGNIATHTQVNKSIDNGEFNKVADSLMDIYAYLFVKYFEQYEFGSNLKIVYSFSILPPIIRYKALNNLYMLMPENLMVVDKLCLSLLKAFNKEIALKWIEDNKNKLSNMPTITKKAGWEIVIKHGYDYYKALEENAPDNMYILCKERISTVSNTLDKKGLLYDSFETAIGIYKSEGIVEGFGEDIVAFNNLMEFVYLGRREEFNEKDNTDYCSVEFKW